MEEPDEEDDAKPVRKDSLIARRKLYVQTEEQLREENLFQTRCFVQGKICSMIIDSGSCANVASEYMVSKLELEVSKHPKPYALQWFNECGAMKVTSQVRVPIRIGSYEDEILCDVLPMESCYILLGKPWKLDRIVLHDGIKNRYSLEHKGKKITLLPMAPREVYQDQMTMVQRRAEMQSKEIESIPKTHEDQDLQHLSKEEDEQTEEVSHSLHINPSEFNELSEPEMSTFTFDYEDTLTFLKAKCDISSMQSDFVLNTLTPEEPVQPSSMILVPQDLERKSVEEAPMNSPMTTNLENKRCKTPERERNQLPSVISFISPKGVPPDKAYQGIHDTKVSLSCELVNYWNNFTYARVIKQPVSNIEISRIMDLIFSISAKKDTGRFDVCKTLTRTGAIMSLKESQCGERQVTAELIHWRKTNLDPGDGIFKRKEVHRSSSIQAFANLFGLKTWSYLKQHELEPGGDKPFQLLKRLIKPINPTHFIQVSISLSHFVSPDLRVGNMSLFHPKSIKKKLGLFVGRLKQYSYLNMLKEELDDKGSYLDRNEVPLLVYRYSKTVIMHLLFARCVDYFAGVKEEPPDLFAITVFSRTGIGVDLTRSNTDLRTNLSQEGGDDMILAGQKREVSSEPELEGRIELRRCLKQFIRLLQQVYSSFRAVKSSTFLPWRLHLVMITK